MDLDLYRFESGSVYELDNGAYIFIGKLNGQTKKEFIEEYEAQHEQ